MKIRYIFVFLFFLLCSCIGPVQKQLEAEKEDCLQKNPDKGTLCQQYFQKATLLYTREPKYDEKAMSMEEYNTLFIQSLQRLRREIGLK